MKSALRTVISKRKTRGIKRAGKTPRWLYPMSTEVQYRTVLIAFVKKLRTLTKEMIDHLIPTIAERDREHTDSWPSNLAGLLEALRVKYNRLADSEVIRTRLIDIGQRTSKWNNVQWQNTMKQVLGVEVLNKEAFLGSHLASFVQENTALVQKLTDTTYQDVTRVVTSGVRNGDRVETIAQDILSKTDLTPLDGSEENLMAKTAARARLIARDQVGKLNGELTELRQKSIGVSEYYWRTVKDERVRDTHIALDGMRCKWDDPSVFSDDDGKTWKDRSAIDAYEGNPGEDFQCRCYAEAIFDEEELTDTELEEAA